MASSIMRWLAAIALAGIVGCGADGGVGGTGISSISGNVALEGGEQPASLEGIGVGIRGTELETETDGSGFFEIEGRFEGDVIVEFTERNGMVSMLPVPVPSGGLVTLRNVHFSQGLASAERIDVLFEANVAGDAVCEGAIGTVEVADPTSSRTFLVRVDGSTIYERGDDRCPENPTCADLIGPRTTVKILGRQSGSIIQAARILFQRCGDHGPRSR